MRVPKAKTWIFAILLLLLGYAGLVAFHTWVMSRRPEGKLQPHDRVHLALVEDLHTIGMQTGIVFLDQDQYLASMFSMPVWKVNQGGIRLPDVTIYALEFQATRNSNGHCFYSAELRYWDGQPQFIQFASGANLTSREWTVRILQSTSAGPDFWRRLQRHLEINKALGDQTWPGLPPLGFKMPRSQPQLRQYEDWLASVLGSRDRLVDGWGHRIKLTIDERSSPPILIAGSMGPDGKWNTPDDMLIKRDTKTGKIVKEKGL